MIKRTLGRTLGFILSVTMVFSSSNMYALAAEIDAGVQEMEAVGESMTDEEPSESEEEGTTESTKESEETESSTEEASKETETETETETESESEEAADPSVVLSGNCGANLRYELRVSDTDDTKYTLSVTGSGAMDDYNSASETPWNEYLTDITDLSLSEGMTRIGSYAFAGLEKIKEIWVPDSVTDIGGNAFMNALDLEMIYIPRSVRGSQIYSPQYSIIYCSETPHYCVNIYCEEEYPSVISSYCGYYFVYRKYDCNIYYGQSKKELKFWRSFAATENVVIPDDITSLPAGAFQNNTVVRTVTIGNGITSIPTNAFRGCTNLETVTLGDNVTYIGECAFENCRKLKGLELGDKVATLGSNVFYNCESIKYFYIPKSVVTVLDEYSRSFFGGNLYENLKVFCEDEAHVWKNDRGYDSYFSIFSDFAPNTCKAFYDISYDDYLYWKDNLDGIDLTDETISIPTGVEEIPGGIFNNISTVKKVVLPDSVKKIRKNAFSGCSNLEYVVLNDGLETIEENVFAKDNSLKAVYIPATVTDIVASSYAESSFLKTNLLCTIYYEGEKADIPQSWSQFWNNYNASSKIKVKYGVSREDFGKIIGAEDSDTSEYKVDGKILLNLLWKEENHSLYITNDGVRVGDPETGDIICEKGEPLVLTGRLEVKNDNSIIVVDDYVEQTVVLDDLNIRLKEMGESFISGKGNLTLELRGENLIIVNDIHVLDDYHYEYDESTGESVRIDEPGRWSPAFVFNSLTFAGDGTLQMTDLMISTLFRGDTVKSSGFTGTLKLKAEGALFADWSDIDISTTGDVKLEVGTESDSSAYSVGTYSNNKDSVFKIKANNISLGLAEANSSSDGQVLYTLGSLSLIATDKVTLNGGSISFIKAYIEGKNGIDIDNSQLRDLAIEEWALYENKKFYVNNEVAALTLVTDGDINISGQTGDQYAMIHSPVCIEKCNSVVVDPNLRGSAFDCWFDITCTGDFIRAAQRNEYGYGSSYAIFDVPREFTVGDMYSQDRVYYQMPMRSYGRLNVAGNMEITYIESRPDFWVDELDITVGGDFIINGQCSYGRCTSAKDLKITANGDIVLDGNEYLFTGETDSVVLTSKTGSIKCVVNDSSYAPLFGGNGTTKKGKIELSAYKDIIAECGGVIAGCADDIKIEAKTGKVDLKSHANYVSWSKERALMSANRNLIIKAADTIDITGVGYPVSVAGNTQIIAGSDINMSTGSNVSLMQSDGMYGCKALVESVNGDITLGANLSVFMGDRLDVRAHRGSITASSATSSVATISADELYLNADGDITISSEVTGYPGILKCNQADISAGNDILIDFSTMLNRLFEKKNASDPSSYAMKAGNAIKLRNDIKLLTPDDTAGGFYYMTVPFSESAVVEVDCKSFDFSIGDNTLAYNMESNAKKVFKPLDSSWKVIARGTDPDNCKVQVYDGNRRLVEGRDYSVVKALSESGQKVQSVSVLQVTELDPAADTYYYINTGMTGKAFVPGITVKPVEVTYAEEDKTAKQVRDELVGRISDAGDSLTSAGLADMLATDAEGDDREGMAVLEADYKEEIGILDENNTITVSDDLAECGIDADSIEVVGAVLNATEDNEKVEVSISKVSDTTELADEYENAVVLDIKLAIDDEEVSGDLAVPVMITMPVPAGITVDDTLKLVHIHGDSAKELAYTIAGEGDNKTITFAVTGFSEFIFANEAGELDVLPAPEFSVESGTELKKGDTVSLSAVEGAKIYYTTDGTDPVASDDNLYSEPIVINDDVIIKAFAVKEGYIDSTIVLSSYTVSRTEPDPEPDPDPDPDPDPEENPWGDIIEEDRALFESPEAVPDGIWTMNIPDAEYTGKAITIPALRVYDNKTLLKIKKDYTLSYKNNINVGSAGDASKAPAVVVTCTGNYAGSVTKTFNITHADISDVTVADILVRYTGSAIKIKPVVKYSGRTLVLNTDYQLFDGEQKVSSYKEGTHTVTVKGINNYTGSTDFEFQVTTLKLASSVTIAPIANEKYKGSQICPEGIVVKHGGKNVTAQFDITYGENIEIGTGTVTVTAKEDSDFIGSKTATFKIVGTNIKNVKLTQSIPARVYDGTAYEPELSLAMPDGTPLTSDDYVVVKYVNNVNVGKAKVTIAGKGAYTGTKTFQYKITPYDLSKIPQGEESLIEVNGGEDISVAFDKGGAKPHPEVTFDGVVLTEKKDYTLAYARNKKVASKDAVNPITGKSVAPVVTITLKGNYKGTIAKTFDITPKNIEDGLSVTLADKVNDKKKAGSWKQTTAVIVDTDGKKLVAKTDYNKKFEYFIDEECTEAITAASVEDGTRVFVRITAAENSNYTGSVVGSYNVAKKLISGVTAKIARQTYTGKPICPTAEEITVTIGTAKTPLTAGEDYIVVPGSYKKNVNKGTASLTIQGIGQYGGTKVVTYKIGTRSIGTILSSLL